MEQFSHFVPLQNCSVHLASYFLKKTAVLFHTYCRFFFPTGKLIAYLIVSRLRRYLPFSSDPSTSATASFSLLATIGSTASAVQSNGTSMVMVTCSLSESSRECCTFPMQNHILPLHTSNPSSASGKLYGPGTRMGFHRVDAGNVTEHPFLDGAVSIMVHTVHADAGNRTVRKKRIQRSQTVVAPSLTS